MIRRTLLLICACMAGIAHAAPREDAAADFAVVDAEFGIFADGRPDELVFAPTRIIPHREGQRYGWVIELRTAKRTLAVSEEYLLPAGDAPGKAADPVSESLNVPTPRRRQVSQRQLAPVDGRIFGEWSVGPHEPAGRRQLQVLIEGRPAASFEYEVK